MEDQNQLPLNQAYKIGFVEGEIKALKTQNAQMEKSIDQIRERQEQIRNELRDEQKEMKIDLKDDIDLVKNELSEKIDILKKSLSEVKLAAESASQSAIETQNSLTVFCAQLNLSLEEKLNPIIESQTQVKTAWKTVVVIASAVSGIVTLLVTVLSLFFK